MLKKIISLLQLPFFEKFKGVYWIMPGDLFYNFQIGQKYFVASFSEPVTAGTNVVLCTINKYGQLGVTAEENLTIVGKLKLAVNKFLCTDSRIFRIYEPWRKAKGRE